LLNVMWFWGKLREVEIEILGSFTPGRERQYGLKIEIITKISGRSHIIICIQYGGALDGIS